MTSCVFPMIMAAAKRIAVLSLLVISLSAVNGKADDSASNAPTLDKPNFSYKTIKTKEGLVFRVPSDMPIEVRDGIQVPVPFDEYMYGKFGNLEAKLAKQEERLTRLEEKLARVSPAETAYSPAVPAKPAKNESGIMKAGTE